MKDRRVSGLVRAFILLKQFEWFEEQARVIEKKKTFSNTEICPFFDTFRVL